MLIIQLIIIQVLTFAALVFVLYKIMYSASFAETKRLQQLSRENAEKARELAAKMEEAEKKYRDKVEAAEKEANRLRAEAKEQSDKIKKEALNKAKQEADRMIKQALNTKEKIREEIEAGLQEKCVEQSLALIQKILISKNMLILHAAVVQDALDEIGMIEASKLNVNTDKGELIIAVEITKAEKEQIASTLSAKTGRKITLEETVDTSIIAGVIIKLGSLIIDGSLRGKLNEACEALRK